MTAVVIDASVAIKWVIEEEGTADALAVRRDKSPIAPDLLIPECANILWKKVRRSQLEPSEAEIAARLLARAEIELVGTRSLLETATRLAIELDHPTYDCIYLALAMNKGCPFVTADRGFVAKVGEFGTPEMRSHLNLLGQAVT
jgi:predicted nucleic acid-binding protein